MNRGDFQQLARIRIREAKVLLDSGNYEGAYYLAGYSVECALKACIAKQTKRYDFPPDVSTTREKIYTHDLKKLLEHAGLEPARKNDMAYNALLAANWTTTQEWSEEKRYEPEIVEARSRGMY